MPAPLILFDQLCFFKTEKRAFIVNIEKPVSDIRSVPTILPFFFFFDQTATLMLSNHFLPYGRKQVPFKNQASL